jgi:hypothetical protein
VIRRSGPPPIGPCGQAQPPEPGFERHHQRTPARPGAGCTRPAAGRSPLRSARAPSRLKTGARTGLLEAIGTRASSAGGRGRPVDR